MTSLDQEIKFPIRTNPLLDSLLFSQRRKVADIVNSWLERNIIHRGPEGRPAMTKRSSTHHTIAALSAFGFLDEVAIKKWLRDQASKSEDIG